jgi:hypothetical protein
MCGSSWLVAWMVLTNAMKADIIRTLLMRARLLLLPQTHNYAVLQHQVGHAFRQQYLSFVFFKVESGIFYYNMLDRAHLYRIPQRHHAVVWCRNEKKFSISLLTCK